MTVLEGNDLRKVFHTCGRTVTAVDGVSFRLERGQALGIVGESGSGKSTIARMVTRLLEPTGGRILLMGREITGVRGRALREIYREIQMVFQLPAESFDPRRTLGDGIGESLRNRGTARGEVQRQVDALLVRCGLTPEFAGRFSHEVSSGQCQRAAIARALAVKPAVLICDEATSALDVTVQKQILELLMELKEREGLSLVLICHDLALVQAFCDQVLVLYRGRVVERGTPEALIQNPQTAYTRELIDSAL